MSNEEKAKEIIGCCQGCYYQQDGRCRNNYCETEFDINRLVEMAEWKDEQEIEFLQSLMFQASTQKALNVIINNRIKLLKGE